MAYAWQNVPLPFCATLLVITATAHKNTPLTLAGMAIERYIAICKPLHHHQICTVRRTYILISLIWGVGVIPGLADLILLSICWLRPEGPPLINAQQKRPKAPSCYMEHSFCSVCCPTLLLS
ncbi:hypothetical protein QQF64_028218 [Cirrhinus molitorella]|uniref:G-protein coupled receptors family 1 profile domain-containing protein n=1 Tax=Cirrhinus molitorella TaxID=172907 RepID=A0ABR3N6C1_9TELE